MPFIRIELAGSFSKEQKAAVVEDVTRSMVDRLGKSPSVVQVVIAEHSLENYGNNGILIADRPAPPAQEVATANGAR